MGAPLPTLLGGSLQGVNSLIEEKVLESTDRSLFWGLLPPDQDSSPSII